MALIDVNQKADIRAVLGAPGTGKSHYTKAEMAKAKRLAVWDIEGEYSDVPLVKLSDLPGVLHRAGKGPFRVRVVPVMEEKKRVAQFNLFCQTLMAIGDVLMVAEELRFVTMPSRAPEWWAAITLRGRKRGIRVIGTSQRPASIDKDFLGSATIIRCGALNYPEDRVAVAKVMSITPDKIAELTGHEAILWHRDKPKTGRKA